MAIMAQAVPMLDITADLGEFTIQEGVANARVQIPIEPRLHSLIGQLAALHGRTVKVETSQTDPKKVTPAEHAATINALLRSCMIHEDWKLTAPSTEGDYDPIPVKSCNGGGSGWTPCAALGRVAVGYGLEHISVGKIYDQAIDSSPASTTEPHTLYARTAISLEMWEASE